MWKRAMVLTVLGAVLAAIPITSVPETNKTQVDLGVVYYLGYGWNVSAPPWQPEGGLGTQGWNDIKFDTLWSGLVTSVPAIGFYSSGDPETIESHLLQMENIGVDFVIVPYQGWGDADLDGLIDDPSYIGVKVHDAAKLVLETAGRLDLQMQFAFMVEPFMEHFSGGKLKPERVSDAQRQSILDRMWNDFYLPYAGQIYLVDGLPLIVAAERFTWGPYQDAKGRYTQRNVVWRRNLGASEDWAWVARDTPPSRVFEDGTIFIWPRYDEFGVWLSHRPDMAGRPMEKILRMDPFLTEGAYDEGWNKIFEDRGQLSRVLIWSWNSWVDFVYIEPDSNISLASHGDLLTRKTRFYIDRLDRGLSFEEFR